jgi:transaldolase/glucose-6-phosphate isomerase
MNENPLLKLQGFGQGIWLDYIRRSVLVSGELGRLIKPRKVWLMAPSARTGGAL